MYLINCIAFTRKKQTCFDIDYVVPIVHFVKAEIFVFSSVLSQKLTTLYVDGLCGVCIWHRHNGLAMSPFAFCVYVPCAFTFYMLLHRGHLPHCL